MAAGPVPELGISEEEPRPGGSLDGPPSGMK